MIIFVVSIFVSSFLLLQIQPMVGKYILPWFGGTTSVWSASLLFFQILLTGGYAYTHWMIGRLPLQRQRKIHLSILAISCALLIVNTLFWDTPILPAASWKPVDSYKPLFDVIKVLFVAVGIPYFLLATNSTLMQAWFIQKYPQRSPYPLYGVSNAASLVGLVTYPFLIEPLFSLKVQSFMWAGFYLLYAVMTGIRAWRINLFIGINPEFNQKTKSTGGRKPTFGQYFSWIGLAGLGTLMLLSTTSQITQEIAPIPLLWILPLSIYLVSFVLTFSGKTWYDRRIFLILLLISTIGYIWFVVTASTDIMLQIAIYTGLFFTVIMICHGELYRLRPEAERLTIFYLMVSIGGAVGGIFVNMVAPLLFKDFWEFQVGLSAIWILMTIWLFRSPISIKSYIHYLVIVIVASATCIVIGSILIQIRKYNNLNIIAQRNFYGVLSVKEYSAGDPDAHRYALSHGITTHGYQFLSPEKRNLPTAYYVEDSGVGIGFKFHPLRPNPLRVGVVGLGVGVLAAYGEDGDEFTFYEINPAILDIATSDYFNYLRDTKAKVDFVLGDGRISLDREMALNGSNNFDYLIVDAFNSDSIPTHLLTKEAFKLYFQHLNSEGILAIHISNRYLNLRPVVWALSDFFDMESLTFTNKSQDIRSSTSSWILVTNNRNFLANPQVIKISVPRTYEFDEIRIWTDDYSNLFQILK